MRRRIIKLKNRIIAFTLASAMLLTMVTANSSFDNNEQSVLAAPQNTENSVNIEESAAEVEATTNEATTSKVDDTTSEVAATEADNTTSETSITKTETTTEETTEETIAAETPEIETYAEEEMELQATLAEAITPSLTIDGAIAVADAYKTEQIAAGNNLVNAPIEKQGDTLKVYNGEGLIILSNINPEEYRNKTISLITTYGWNVTEGITVGDDTYVFLGLGDSTNPFAGTCAIDNSSAGFPFITNESLFNAISDAATLTGTYIFNITADNAESTNPVFAGQVFAGEGDEVLNCRIVLEDDADVKTCSIGGIIGSLEAGANAHVDLNNNVNSSMTVTGTDHIGLFCNTMKAGSKLEVKNTSSSGSLKVSATENNKDAGGFVGHMETGSSLTMSGVTVNTVEAMKGNAGGIVGSADNADVKIAEGTDITMTFDVSIASASNKSAGGFIGDYTNALGINLSPKEFSLADYIFTNVTISGNANGETNTNNVSSNSGALFGSFKNSGCFTINGATGDSGSNISVTINKYTKNYGGLIGTYQAVDGETSARNAALNINSINMITSTGGEKTTVYGGVIGVINGNSFVDLNNVSVATSDMPSYYGGVVGRMTNGAFLNAGNVTVKTSNTYDLQKDGMNGRGGIAGHIETGAIRLYGTTDLSQMKITCDYDRVGQLIGVNDHGIIYAYGDGNGNYGGAANANAWTLKRYTGTDRMGSDIGNWGEVIRLDGETLTEGDGTSATDLFAFSKATHTVTVKSSFGTSSANTCTIANTRDFAAYSIAFDSYSDNKYPSANNSSSTVIFDSTVNWTSEQTVTLSGDVDLTGTGIIGISKYANNSNKSYDFSGSFNGGNHTITLDIGSTYGMAGDSPATGEGSGQLYARRINNNCAHNSLALFPYAKDVNISNLTVDGKVLLVLGKSSQNENQSSKHTVSSAVIGILNNGNARFDNVTVKTGNTYRNYSNRNTYGSQAGFIGISTNSKEVNISFSNCIWSSESIITTDRTSAYHYMGGMIGIIAGLNQTNLTVDGCTISGKLESTGTKTDVNVGGLVADIPGGSINNGHYDIKDTSICNISVTDLTVDGERIVANTATSTSGGLLGYRWNKVLVTFGDGTKAGVTIKNSSVNAGSLAVYGGLVYQASGYINATNPNSIVFANDKKTNTFIGKSEAGNTSGLIACRGFVTVGSSEECALYLEVGTFGKEGAAYYIAPSAASVSTSADSVTKPEYFDELVGKTINNNAGNNNAVVSLAVHDGDSATAIDSDTANCNTYISQIDSDNSFKNKNTRYYYNLDSYREAGVNGTSQISAGNLSTSGEVLSWSVSQYVAKNIRAYFCTIDNNKNTEDAIITGDIDLTGYSYYPISPITNVTINGASLVFNHSDIDKAETSAPNKLLTSVESQHYLMHCGLLYNTGKNLSVSDTSISGSVGKIGTTSCNSGALLYGNISGDLSTATPVIAEVTIENVSLDGLCLSGNDISSVVYAPLLINTIGEGVTLTVDGLSTGVGYLEGQYAATSLIGNIGNENAQSIIISFANIALDGRTEAASGATSVYNNGSVEVVYNTTHSIFTRAILLESLKYASDSSAVYNFNNDDSKVTYGVELSNNNSQDPTGRNPEKQYQYYNGGFISDVNGVTAADAEAVKARYTSSNFLRYVRGAEGASTNGHELDINQKATGLIEGCGTYGDPYIITDGLQLVSLANFINNSAQVSSFEVTFNSKVIADKKQLATGYHTKGAATTSETGSDITYQWNGSAWVYGGTGTEDTAMTANVNSNALIYLLNAYYKIDKNITYTCSDFQGLGTLDNPFSGVIVGNNNNTISITGSISGITNYGGIIRYSQGSVVKDLIVDYSSEGTSITLNNTAVTKYDNNPFFGGVIGYCLGGDTIIVNVSVNYGAGSVNVTGSGSYQKMIPQGGYVGLVGGGRNSNNKELTGGGVIFRNMGNHVNTFGTAQEEAIKNAPKVDMSGNITTAGGLYLYCNPYVGRVLDGYVCYDGGTAGECTLNNTDKNYEIPDVERPDLNNGTADLSVDSNFNVSVNSAQGLWILSSIICSGAGSMDGSNEYVDNNGIITAYNTGKPRSCNYDKIGAADGSVDIADEAFYGGVVDKNSERVSFLVKCFTNKADDGIYYASRIIGGTTPPSVTLSFDVDKCDMTAYGNGFRGIGGSFGPTKKTWGNTTVINGRYLKLKNLNGRNSSGTEVIIAINRNDYSQNYSNGVNGWHVHGVALFTGLYYEDGCVIKNISISGSSKLMMYSVSENTIKTLSKDREDNGDIGVAGFASQTVNSKGTVTLDGLRLEDMEIFGGHHCAGAISLLEQSNGNNKTVVFKNWSIGKGAKNTGVTISKLTYNDGSSAGLMGWCYGGTVKIYGYGKDSSEWDIDGLTVTAYTNYTKSAAAAGLTGAADACTFVVDGVRARDMNITGIYSRDASGFISGVRSGGTASVKNSVIEGSTIVGIHTTYIGGLFGGIERDTVIDNVDIDNTVIYGDVAHVGNNYSSSNIGGLAGYSNAKTTITKVNISANNGETKIYSKCDIAKTNNNNKEARVGGFIGLAQGAEVKIESCSITGTDNYAIKILNSTQKDNESNNCGGFIGNLSSNNKTITFNNNIIRNAFILSGDIAGGIIGIHDQKKLNISNLSIVDCIVAIPMQKDKNMRSKNSASMLIGYSKNYIYGYNIMIKGGGVGYYNGWQIVDTGQKPPKSADELLDCMSKNSIGNTTLGLHYDANNSGTPYFRPYQGITDDNFISKYIGRWIGKSDSTADTASPTGKRNCTLVAVSAYDCMLPNTDIGRSTTDIDNVLSIVYADYPAITSYGENTLSAKPWQDINPNSNIQIKDSATATTGKYLTGNGIGCMTETVSKENSISYKILSEAQRSDLGVKRVYCNLVDGEDKTFSQFLENTNPAYITTYQDEEQTTIESESGLAQAKFPVLVINNTADADTLIWNYIAALSNISDGEKARSKADSVNAYTYKWNEAASCFVKQTGTASITVSTKTIRITKNAYDNQRNQITLLDVKYKNPTTTTTNKSNDYYHLYIPVIVKKVLETRFSVKFLTGTNYYAPAYKTVDYATAGFDEPVTALIEYNYNRKGSDWQLDIDNGESLLWYYDKALNLAASGKQILPSGTRLTWVDRQTGQYYTYVFGENDDVNSFNTSVMKTPDGSAFTPVPICDLLGLTATPDADGTYIRLDDENGATIRVDGIYYRKAQEEESGDRYTIQVSDAIPSVDEANNFLPVSEGYYLTIQIPKCNESIINNPLTYEKKILDGNNGAPPAVIKTYNTVKSICSYVIYDGVKQSFVVSTNRTRNGVLQNDTIMENGDSIKVTLTSELSLTEQGRNNFNSLGPDSQYQRFDIAMKKYLKETVEDNVIGADGVKYTYTVKTNDGTVIYENTESLAGVDSKDSLEISYGSKEIVDELKNDKTIIITADIVLTYPMAGEYFPSRIAADETDDSGISVSATSRIASIENQLPITSSKINKEDSKRYYVTNPSRASLTYSAIDRTGAIDYNQQLGINPNDSEENQSYLIYTVGDYDYSNIDSDILDEAVKVRYTLSLYQKDENGNYKDALPLEIAEYLQNVEETGGATLTLSDDKKYMTVEKPFVKDTSLLHTTIALDYAPLTGAAFEAKGYTYANYRVKLTAVLVDGSGNELQGTIATDYIVYTNARIYQQMIQDTN